MHLLSTAIFFGVLLTRSVSSAGTESNQTSYDFIVVGGGLTGLVIADRLTENPNVSVLVISSGPLVDPEPPELSVPGAWDTSAYLYQDTISTPQPGLNGKSFLAAAGNVVGGGSIVNALWWFRSSRDEYNAWSHLGASNLTWNTILPYFKKSENFSSPDPQFAKQANISYNPGVHGTSGPIHSSYANFYYPSSENWWTAALSTGLTPVQDVDDGNQIGLSSVPFIVDPTNRTRSDARTGYFTHTGASEWPNYHLLLNTTVERILFSGNAATGVQYIPSAGGSPRVATAKKEVLVAAGGIHTPQILQLSGVGPSKLLGRFNISVVSDLPGVGTNLQDTPIFAIPYNVTNNRFPNANTFMTNTTYQQEQLAIYNANHTGPYVLLRNEGSNAAILSLEDVTPNYMSIIRDAEKRHPGTFLPNNTDPTVLAGYTRQREVRFRQLGNSKVPSSWIVWGTGNTAQILLTTQFSRGSVTINSTNVLQEPTIDWRSMTDPIDYEIMVATVLRNRRVMTAPSMRSLDAHEAAPFGDNITDFDTLKAALAEVGSPTIGHVCCTAPQMSRELGGVVDSEYKVYGVEGLRVVDIAAVPLLFTLPPQAALYGLAERIADLIKEEYHM